MSSSRSARTRSVARAVARRLPPVAQQALVRARGLASTSPAAERATTRNGRAKTPPKTFRISPAPMPIPDDWPEAPEVAVPGAPVRSVYVSGGSAPTYDIDLFEKLNDEYASKPIVPAPQGKDTARRADRARSRLTSIHQAINLAAPLRVLEFGCGAGYEIWYLANHLGADAYGVDVVERAAWASLAGERAHYECADLARQQPFAADFFDRVISFSVFEHVQHPFAALTELHRIMKPGALAWISANLYRSAVASHLYHEVHFPYPHLLFTDDVIKEFYRRRGEKPRGASWVNKLTWLEYERHFRDLGFEIRMLRFSERGLDEEFYARFEDVLGRYPRWDLTKDFFNVVLEKKR